MHSEQHLRPPRVTLGHFAWLKFKGGYVKQNINTIRDVLHHLHGYVNICLWYS